jgi:hypothetical protein
MENPDQLATLLKNHICKYKKQRNRINNLKKIAKENFKINLDNIILENASNNKTYWKIMKKLLKSYKGSISNSNCLNHW